MNSVLGLWAYDKRWMFGCRNPLGYWSILAMAALNSLQLSLIARTTLSSEPVQLYIGSLLVLMYTLTVLLQLWVFRELYAKQMHNQLLYEGKPNNSRIMVHKMEWQFRKMAAGWAGLSLIYVDLLLTVVQKCAYSAELQYPCRGLFYSINLLSWAYILFIAISYILVKTSVLACAWKYPRLYLTARGLY